MKAKAKTFLNLALLFALVLSPGFSVYSNAQEIGLAANPPNVVVVNRPELKVVETQKTGVVVSPGSKVAMLSDCSVPLGSLFVVQGQAQINFNQPADCFSLTSAVSRQPQVQLKVAPLAYAAVKIVLTGARLVKDYLKQPLGMPKETTAPSSPVIAFVLFMSIAFSFFQTKRANRFISNFKKALTLHELKVMRC